MFYYPTSKVPKSNARVWLPLLSMTKRAKSTDVAWRSIWSLTKIESDFKLMIPLKSPASTGLYLTVIFDYYLAAIFKSLG